jgi:hypothetical protein
MSPVSSSREQNKILAALSPEDFAAIAPRFELQSLERHRLLYSPEDRMRYAYFPLSCVISLLEMDTEGDVEVVLAGPEGMVGVPASLDTARPIAQAMVQYPGEALVLDYPDFHANCRQSPLIPLTRLYYWLFFRILVRNVLCGTLHRPDERVAKWLLLFHDRIDGDSFHLTQVGLARILGARRTSVTATAVTLEERGLIQYRRGDVVIKDRKGLEACACNCYEVISRDMAIYYESLKDGGRLR